MARPRLALAPYRTGDIDRFTPRGDMAQEKAAVAWAWPEGPPPGHTWTLYDETGSASVVLGVGGVFHAGRGRWHAWALVTELTPRQWYMAGALAQNALDAVTRFNRAAQISATARASMPAAERLLEKLGFRSGEVYIDNRVGRDVLYRHMIRAA